MMTQEMEQLIARVETQFRAEFSRVMPPGFDYRRIAEEFFSEERAGEQAALVSRLVPGGLAGRRLLEVGSAYGVFVQAAEKAGAEAYGVEPAPGQFSETIDGCRVYFKLKGAQLRVAAGVGEQLPFKDNAFDVVASFNVLEHVSAPAAVLGEIARVLAPGGRAIINVPNYGSVWEGHYGILWPPYIPKPLAKLYARLIGRDPAFIDTLQFITVPKLRRIMKQQSGNVKVITYGKEIFRERLETADIFAAWANLGRLRRWVTLLHKLKIQKFAAAIANALNMHTPIILVFEKKSH